jgi:site-specific recombinase XerD
MLLDEAIEQYRYSVLDLTPDTQRWYEHKLRHFAEWCHQDAQGREIELSDIHPSLIRKFLEYYRTTDTKQFGKLPSAYTVRGSAQVVKGFLSWCSDEGLLRNADIARRIRMPKVDQKVIETFTPEQIKRLFAACRNESYITLQYRDRAMLAVFLGTGVRAGELCGMRTSDVSLDPKNARGNYVKVFGKGRKEREVGLPASAVEHLMKYIRRYRFADETEPRIFLSRAGQPMTPSGLYQWMDRLGEWAGITGVRCSPHTLRHTFAVQYLLAGGDVYLLSRILGHSTVSTTEIYLKSMKQHQVRKASFSVLDRINEKR